MQFARRLWQQDKFRFFISGSLGFVADAGSLWLFTSILGLKLVLFDLIVVANLLAVAIGVTVSFLLHRHLSFQAGQGSLVVQSGKYLGFYVLSYALNQVLFGIFSVQLGLSLLASKVVVSLMQMVWNYFLFKHVVFK